MTLLLALLACEPTCELTLDEVMVDECAGTCLTLEGSPGAAYTLSAEPRGVLAEGALDGDGRAEVCVEGPFPRGAMRLSATLGRATCEADVVVRNFGWAWGLDKPDTTPPVPEAPVFSGLDDAPVLSPSPDGWDSVTVSMPSYAHFLDQELLFYAGAGEDGVYGLGLAREQGDGWTKDDEPLLNAAATGAQPGDWDFESQNTPEALVDGDTLRLYYNGRDDLLYTLSIGLATSVDGVTFTPSAENPVLPGGGVSGSFEQGALAHASALLRDGVTELWFASGTLQLGYALSADGVHFQRYCKGPVFEGLGRESWDEGEVKAPSVVWDGERYWMAWSGGGKGSYQIGWAQSDDGLSWAASPDPVAPASGDSSWNGKTTQGADLTLDGDVWRMWYAGHDGSTTAVGLLTAPR